MNSVANSLAVDDADKFTHIVTSRVSKESFAHPAIASCNNGFNTFGLCSIATEDRWL
jgi:hypothetical protein